jgi:hypothetical protein
MSESDGRKEVSRMADKKKIVVKKNERYLGTLLG